MTKTIFTLTRVQADAVSTRGAITDQSGFQICLTLERGATGAIARIPAGTYPIVFKKIGQSHFDAAYQKIVGVAYEGMPQVCNVPGRSEILIHCGNTVQDSIGCIEAGGDIVPSADGFKIVGGTSQPAYRHLYPILEAAARAGDVEFIIIDPVAAIA